MIATLHRLDVTRLAADYSQSVREALTSNQLDKVRRGDAVAHDYVESGELLVEAVYLQQPHAESIADLGAELVEAEQRASASGYWLSRILVGCEFSATVRDAFAARGHDVTSCDLLPSDNPNGKHYMGDVRDILTDGWHMAIMHPVCTYIAACQLWRCQPKHDPSREREAKRQEALQFVRELGEAPIERMCVENPKSCIGTEGVLPGFVSQMVQPHHYGHDYSKETYLWRRDLPELVSDPANHIEGRDAINNAGNPVKRWANQCDGSGADSRGPSATRGHERSKFFTGIADAMADQWGGIARRMSTAKVLPMGQLALF